MKLRITLLFISGFAHAAEFTISITDAATQQPVAARVYVENAETGTRHFVRAHSKLDGVIYEKQNWANKRSIEYHTSVPAAPFVAENLLAGTYTLTVERGKEYFPETRRIVLAEGEKRAVETVALRRWVNMAERGWWSGETHLHRPLSELPVVLQAEDLNVAMPLTYWVTKAFTPPSQGNKNQSGEIPAQLIAVDATHVIWPRNTEYEIFSVGEHKHTLGALFVLNHKSVFDKGVPDWKPVAEQARAEGAVMDMDKLDWPFGMTLPLTSGATLYELANNHMWRTEFGLTKWVTPAPAFLQPPNGGAGGDERDWLAYTLGQYYTLLDAGFRLVPTAGTASGVHPVPAGFSRVYVKMDGAFSYEKWLAELKAGRSFVTTGPMIFAVVNGQQPGATLAGDSVKLTASIVSEHPLANIEVVSNGKVIATLNPQNKPTPEGARQSEVTAEIPTSTSGWVCLRCTEDRPDKRLRFAHTAPWWIEIPGKPLRPTQQEKDYLIARVKSEIARSTGIVPASALEEYEAALKHFDAMPAASLPQVERVDAQPLLLLTKRLTEAMQTMGAPFSAEQTAALTALNAKTNEATITAGTQRVLDPLCFAAVEIGADGAIQITPGEVAEVEENGWRTVLVKVLNRAGVRSRLRIESPNARPIPHGPQDDIASRWLSLAPCDGRPMDANLSGLALEYRAVQISSTHPGERTARIEFNAGVPGAKDSPVIRQWRFGKDSDGWGDIKDLTMDVRDNALHLTATGNDPYLTAPVQARGGKMVLRFWGKTDSSDMAQFFWWTDQLPQPDGQRQKTFQLNAGREQEYAIEFSVEGELRGVRLDPLQGKGAFRIDWVSLDYAPGENGKWAGANVSVRTVPSTEVKFAVNDADGTACMAAFEIRDAHGRIYPAQPKRQAPDFFFHPQIYRETGESIRLPSGIYTVKCSHGPESIAETKTLTVGAEPVTFTYAAKRWLDMAKLGWWSGDHHIHAAGCLHYENPTQGVNPSDMLRHIMGEDVKVGCCLTWGPCFDFQKQFFTGKPDDVSRYPYLLRYDIEVSGFGSTQSGHLNLLKLKQQIPDGGDSKKHWPTLGMNTLRWAKKQGAVTGPAHSGSGLTRFVGRTSGTDGPRRLPNFDVPAFDGIGANEFIMQVTHEVPGPDGKLEPAIDFISTMNTSREAEWNIWYHVLNCGLRIVASGETDFPCMSGERVGMGRVYVKLDGLLDYDRWAEALRRGESYVSDGTCHLFDFERKADGTFAVKTAALLTGEPDVELEWIVNGRAISAQKVKANGTIRELTFAAPKLDRSSWVAARIFPSAHTNPVWVKVDDKPVRERASAEWCLAGLEQCWKSKQRTYAPAEMEQAKADYEHARITYRRILDESTR